MPILKRFSLRPARSFRGAPPAPATPFFVVGDVHGRKDLLAPLLDRLLPSKAPIVLVGDYVDRGDDSAGVLELLETITATKQVICLRGNHEEMLLKFIETPKKVGRSWLRHGGLQTLASYGIGGLDQTSGQDQLQQARDSLLDALGAQLDWLRALPYFWQSGNVAVVHAGADPDLPLDAQPVKSMAWGHEDFQHRDRRDGLWIIHGHTIVPKIQIRQGRVAIDTGAYATGILSAVHVTDGKITPI